MRKEIIQTMGEQVVEGGSQDRGGGKATDFGQQKVGSCSTLPNTHSMATGRRN